MTLNPMIRVRELCLLVAAGAALSLLASGFRADPYTADCSGCEELGRDAPCQKKTQTRYHCLAGESDCPLDGPCEATGESGVCKKNLVLGWYCKVD